MGRRDRGRQNNETNLRARSTKRFSGKKEDDCRRGEYQVLKTYATIALQDVANVGTIDASDRQQRRGMLWQVHSMTEASIAAASSERRAFQIILKHEASSATTGTAKACTILVKTENEQSA